MQETTFQQNYALREIVITQTIQTARGQVRELQTFSYPKQREMVRGGRGKKPTESNVPCTRNQAL